ncbi:transposase [Gemella sp. zg-570]|uniref:transposase n=1 Tax=unclassified Gemella TaxID=2624949 RepID=UPI00352D22DF
MRKKVKTICIYIYPPYMKLIKEIFPKAEIIIDRFHIVQNINREFNKYRIQLMNKFKNKERHIYI